MQLINLLGADTDEELVRRARLKDPEAERLLIHRLYPGVYSLCSRLIHDPELTRDATQEAFLRAFSKLDQFDGVHRFSAWVFKILVNLIRDLGRRKGRVVVMELEPDDWPCRLPLPVEAAIQAEAAVRVRAEIGKLPEHLRAALLLHFQEGFTGREVAYALGISHDAARLKISRAVAKLRQRMEGGE